MSHPPHVPPHEPEIEALARAARGALWLLRIVFWLAGATAIGYGIWRAMNGADAHPGSLSATGVVWLCAGLPLVAPVDWLFGRGRLPALGAAATLWFSASLLPDDVEYGFLLRIFGSVMACLILLVWRTLWGLTASSAPPQR